MKQFKSLYEDIIKGSLNKNINKNRFKEDY